LIPVFKPYFDERELEALREPFESGWIGEGPKVAEFEEKFAKYVGAKHAIALNSATAALHLSLATLDLQPEDEVLVPAITFVSTAHAAIYAGGVPVFVDVDPETLCIDVEDARAKITAKTRAIVPVHFGGFPCDMDAIFALAKEHDLDIIEDAAHAAGTRFKDTMIGGLSSTATCFSFHAVKNLATGDGGMVTTNDDATAERIRTLRWVGISRSTYERSGSGGSNETSATAQLYGSYRWYYEVSELGYKYHMNDISAAIGIVQLDKLPKANELRRSVASRYREAFANLDSMSLPPRSDDHESATHNFVIQVKNRDSLASSLAERGISTGVHYMPVHMHPFYETNESIVPNVPVAERVWLDLLTLPIYPGMTDDDVSSVIAGVLDWVNQTT
jgi:perosamine synthetase